METKSWLNSWYGKNPIYLQGFSTIQMVVVWVFWTINSSNKHTKNFAFRHHQRRGDRMLEWENPQTWKTVSFFRTKTASQDARTAGIWTWQPLGPLLKVKLLVG